jgi:two-component system sensor histidine kinase BarA
LDGLRGAPYNAVVAQPTRSSPLTPRPSLSYTTFKRVLGETNLERKCRRLFGIAMLLLITGSFYLYSLKNEEIVADQNQFLGEVVAAAAVMEAHFNVQDEDVDPWMARVDQKLSEMLRARPYRWKAIYPVNEAGLNKPSDDFEWELLDRWQKLGEQLHSDADVDRQKVDNKQWVQRSMPHVPNEGPDAVDDDSTKDWQQFYVPVFAHQYCLKCHSPAKGRQPIAAEVGGLLSVLRLEMDIQDTREAQAQNRAWLITLGIVTVALAMLALYVIVRYIIVKPLAHLRDVSDAVRRGDVEQRAVIHTGDEFEELGAAFNRMLRQLLRQQDELRNVNGELDTKIDELAQTNMRLFQSNKVKGDFLATVSHELRTPLNSILGFSDLLASVKTLDDKQRRFATNIERSGRQLLDMINDMLDLAKIESGRMEIRPSEFDVGAVVMTQCDLVRPLAEKKHIELDCEVAADLPPIVQDRGKIEQVLNNLLTNAVKFTPDGGRIHVTAHQDRRGDLRLTVADTGVGISEHEQVAVFEKFRQGASALAGGDALKREYSGSGLGLSIVRELCRLLGGDITLESELGRGSEFTVILPWNLVERNGDANSDPAAMEDLRQLAAARSVDPGADI